MSKYKVLKDNIKNVVAQEFEKTIPIITEEYEAKIRRQAEEITRLLSENKRLKAENGNGLWNIEQARAEGQNEAWELARKIVLMEKEGGMKDEDYKAIFGGCQPSDYILKTHTYPEAAAKVKAWKKAKEEIKDDEDCLKCQFFEKHNDEYPCSHCRHCYTSKFKQIGGEE
mgnify:CR=1 FL=1